MIALDKKIVDKRSNYKKRNWNWQYWSELSVAFIRVHMLADICISMLPSFFLANRNYKSTITTDSRDEEKLKEMKQN